MGETLPLRAEVASRTRIPVCILTGFLGAGKTTLLNEIMAKPDMAGTAVLINEYGSIGVDHRLVETAGDPVLLLDSGCLCCSMRGGFVNALLSLVNHDAHSAGRGLRRIIVETTGLADPLPIVTALRDSAALAERFVCRTVATVIDGTADPAELASNGEAQRQVVMADRIVISKQDIAIPGRIGAIEEWLNGLNAGAERVIRGLGHIDAHWLFTASCADYTAAPQRTWGAVHSKDTSTFTVPFTRPPSWSVLSSILTDLLDRHGPHLLRVKGIIRIAELHEPIVVQCVRNKLYPPSRVSHPSPAQELGDGCGALVFITKGLDKAAQAHIRDSLLLGADYP